MLFVTVARVIVARDNDKCWTLVRNRDEEIADRGVVPGVIPGVVGLTMCTMDTNRLTNERRLLRPDELASILGIPLATIYRWRSRGDGPPGIRVGRHVRYRLEDVDRWLDERRDRHTRG